MNRHEVWAVIQSDGTLVYAHQHRVACDLFVKRRPPGAMRAEIVEGAFIAKRSKKAIKRPLPAPPRTDDEKE